MVWMRWLEVKKKRGPPLLSAIGDLPVSGELIGGSETFGSAKRAAIEKHRMISLEVLPRLTE